MVLEELRFFLQTGIGRQVFKKIYEDYQGVLDVEAVNDLVPVETNAHLLKYDSTYGRFPGEVESRAGDIYVNGEKLKSYAERDPAKLPWGELGVDIVLECTGIFKDRDSAGKHLEAGAKKVIISAPGKGVDGTFVLGVNASDYDPQTQHVLSNASCTTNCLAPAAKALNDAFGIEKGLMVTVHGYTNDQKILDQVGSDLHRARAAAVNIIPTSTGAAKAVGKVIKELNGKLTGMAFRVPTPDVSVVDLTCELEKETTQEEICAAMKAAAESDRMKGILAYDTDHVVSSDIVGSSYSSIFDPGFTSVIDGNLLKTVSWYDNEYGYSCRVVDLLQLLEDVG